MEAELDFLIVTLTDSGHVTVSGRFKQLLGRTYPHFATRFHLEDAADHTLEELWSIAVQRVVEDSPQSGYDG
ncbi:hypothetical protein [Candidatus Palauibacter sp.]|uniref:hypothetical protein n=1 Tax=Candidatus Palauibacter sp. TaxID=3101350 RepID=UPI003B01E6A3